MPDYAYINDFCVITGDDNKSAINEVQSKGCSVKQPLENAVCASKDLLKNVAEIEKLKGIDIELIIYVHSAMKEYLLWPVHCALQNELNMNGKQSLTLTACENGVIRAIDYASNYVKRNKESGVLIVQSDCYTAMNANVLIHVPDCYMDSASAILISRVPVGLKILDTIEMKLDDQDGYFKYPEESIEKDPLKEDCSAGILKYPLPRFVRPEHYERMTRDIVGNRNKSSECVWPAAGLETHYGAGTPIVELSKLLEDRKTKTFFVASCDQDYYGMGICLEVEQCK